MMGVIVMTNERWKKLMNDPFLFLTYEEKSNGYHFCPDWDWMLIGNGMEEKESCTCKGVS